MTIESAKTELVRLLTEESNKVVALSGPWGTGKTYLWNEIRTTAGLPNIQSALYVSLFGVKDINQLKLKVVQSVLPIGGESSTLTEGITKAYRVTVEALKKTHGAWAALDELALIAVPAALRNRFVVIDDIERKHAGLSVDEILGFVDEYTQRFGTRMLLILNSGKLAGEADDALWATFREKVVDEELCFCPTPAEAFDIAVPEGSSSFREAVRQAAEACGLTNIRIIRKVSRVVERLLGARADLPAAVQARTIPSIVLLAATHHKAIKDGPDFDFVENFNRRGNEWDRYLSNKPAEDPAAETPKPSAGWTLLMSKLGINSADEFEELVIAYLTEGKHDVVEISTVIDGYCANADRMDVTAIAHHFVEQFNWDHRLSDEALLAEARVVAERAAELDAFFVTSLHRQISELAGGPAVADAMVDAWIEKFKSRSTSADSDGFPFNRPLLPRIKEAMEAMRAARIEDGSLAEVVASLVTHDGWGHREEAVMKRSTVEEYVDTIRALDGHSFKLFLLKNLDILEHGETYDRHFGEARHRFLEACRRICAEDPESRLSKLLKALFAESKVPTLLNPPASEQADG